MSKSFYMLRHGQTVGNRDGYACGWADVELTDLGVKQAHEVAALVKALELKPSAVVHTGLQRSRETAKIVHADMDCPFIECLDLREQNFGDWERGPWSRIGGLIDKLGVNPPNGEAQLEFFDRIQAALPALLSQFNERALLVTHGGVFDAFVVPYGKSLGHVGNCHLHAFEWTGEGDFPYNVTSFAMDGDVVKLSHLEL